MEEPESDLNREYFYVVYGAFGLNGAGILAQHRIPGVEVNPDGFNLAGAHQWLHQLFGMPMIVKSWVKITKKRKDEFEKYVQGVTAASGEIMPGNAKRSHLHIVKTEDSNPFPFPPNAS